MQKNEYPDGLNLSPESELHGEIVRKVVAAARRGYSAGADMRARAREVDRTLKTFVPVKYSEDFLRMRDYGRPDAPLEIVVPASKNSRDTWLTYMAGSQLSDPANIYSLIGHGGPAGTVRAAKFERLLNAQGAWFQHDISFMTFWGDAFSHGVGVIVPEWTKHIRRVPMQEEVSDVLHLLLKKAGVSGINRSDIVRYVDERVIHEGSRIQNCSVYNVIMDPNTPMQDQERSEYCGWIERTNTQQLLKRSVDPEERLFNIGRLREIVKGRQGNTSGSIRESGEYGYPTVHEHEFPGYDTETCDIIHMYMRVLPKEWKIGTDERPALYEFVIGAEEVLIGLRKLDYDHGRLPMLFGSPSADGYETFPFSELGSTYGLQQFCDWKLRAQVANQSKVLNDMILVDPSMFEEEDLLNPAPGKFIRTRRSLFGLGGIDQFIKQLNVVDVTGGNLNDVQTMVQLMYQMLGTSDITMGDMSHMPERPTAALGMAARSSALSRLQYMAQKLAAQVMPSLTWMLAHNTLQFMTEDVRVSILGAKYEDQLRTEMGLPTGVNEVAVSPWDLDLDFDVAPVSNMSKDGNIAAMGTVVERMLSVPDIAMEAFSGIDIRRLLLAYVRKSGFGDVQEYLIKNDKLPGVSPSVMPDEQVLQEVQAGNLIPEDQFTG
jgi:hypothetical protein